MKVFHPKTEGVVERTRDDPDAYCILMRHAQQLEGIWTSERPRSSGYYWFRRDEHDRAKIIEIDAASGLVCFIGSDITDELSNLRGEFKGPLYP